jgi:hypothetical protein
MVLDQATPLEKGTNNEKLFTLARGVLTLKVQNGREMTSDEVDQLFDLWFVRARSFLNETGPHRMSPPGEIKTDYRIEFLRQLPRAQKPLDLDTIAIAWRNAQNGELPAEALKYDGTTRLVIALCREMQRLQGKEPIFIPTRRGMKLLGVASNHTISNICEFLCRERLLKLHAQGGPTAEDPEMRHKSNRYFYLGKL